MVELLLVCAAQLLMACEEIGEWVNFDIGETLAAQKLDGCPLVDLNDLDAVKVTCDEQTEQKKAMCIRKCCNRSVATAVRTSVVSVPVGVGRGVHMRSQVYHHAGNVNGMAVTHCGALINSPGSESLYEAEIIDTVTVQSL